MLNPAQAEPVFKVILLGNSGVGKTSLATRWLNGSFDESSRPTIGASNYLKELQTDDGKIRVTLWDTAGHEQFRSITPLYVRGAKVGIIVASVTDLDSFDAISSWIDILNQNQEVNVPSVLAVSKIDIEEPIPEDKIEMIKPRLAGVYFVSAKSGEGVENLFRECAILASKQPKNTLPKQIIVEENKTLKKSKTCC